jgi:hypothetical protein
MNNPDKLSELIIGQLTDLVNNHRADIADALAKAADGKLSVGLGSKLILSAGHVHCTSTVTYGLRVKDKIEDGVEWDDPNQLKIGGVE